jgi:hypothetical protein
MRNVLRTIRISEEIARTLEEDAKSKGVSVNSLISMILSRYVEWDRFADRIPFVSVAREGFRLLHEAVDDNKLEEVAKRIGSTNPREMTMFMFKKISVETVLDYLKRHCKYGKIGELEVEVKGREYVITLHHSMGQKFSKFLSYWLKEVMRSTLNVKGEVQVESNSVIMRFIL